MADSKIKTSSPMTFSHFRYDVGAVARSEASSLGMQAAGKLPRGLAQEQCG